MLNRHFPADFSILFAIFEAIFDRLFINPLKKTKILSLTKPYLRWIYLRVAVGNVRVSESLSGIFGFSLNANLFTGKLSKLCNHTRTKTCFSIMRFNREKITFEFIIIELFISEQKYLIHICNRTELRRKKIRKRIVKQPPQNTRK